MVETKSICLNKEQDEFIEESKWKFRVSKSKICIVMVNYFLKNPDKLEELLKNDKKK